MHGCVTHRSGASRATIRPDDDPARRAAHPCPTSTPVQRPTRPRQGPAPGSPAGSPGVPPPDRARPRPAARRQGRPDSRGRRASGPACCTWRRRPPDRRRRPRTTLAGFVDDVTATPTPTPTVAGRQRLARLLAPPEEPYTNQAKVDLVVTVPRRRRIHRPPDPGLPRAPGPARGRRSRTSRSRPTRRRPSSRSSSRRASTTSRSRSSGRAASRTPRRSCATSSTTPSRRSRSPRPRTRRRSTARASTIKGKVQARSTLIIRNTDNDASITGTAEADGTFSLKIALSDRDEPHHHQRDRPGRQRQRDGADRPARHRQADGLRLRVRLPDLAQVAAAGGPARVLGHRPRRQRRSPGADVTFTLSIPGISTITSDAKTEQQRPGRLRDHDPRRAPTAGQGNATVPRLDRRRSARPRTSRSSPSRSSPAVERPFGTGGRRASTAAPSRRLPSAHADVAMPPLRDTAGRDGSLLGLPSIQHRLSDLSAFRRSVAAKIGLLRPGPRGGAAQRRRDPGVLGGRAVGSTLPSIAVAPAERCAGRDGTPPRLAFVEVVAAPAVGQSPGAEAQATSTATPDAPLTAFDRARGALEPLGGLTPDR